VTHIIFIKIHFYKFKENIMKAYGYTTVSHIKKRKLIKSTLKEKLTQSEFNALTQGQNPFARNHPYFVAVKQNLGYQDRPHAYVPNYEEDTISHEHSICSQKSYGICINGSQMSYGCLSSLPK
jgi:hypothetical protein